MANHLADESSPYLRQHADNPVDWYPWGETALRLAKDTGKPILLSIGYSTCHWCHVMAQESFANDATAAVMNDNFVNIKVDREERPDLDKVYQTALQLINPQGGGWPLTMFLDPETLLPFYGGTYFPPEPRYQLPGLRDLLLRLKDVFTQQHDEISQQGDKLQLTLGQMSPPTQDAEIGDMALLQLARDQLGQQYDPQYGGFGKAPKFPMPNTLTRILRHWSYSKKTKGRDRDALDVVMISLTQMARGGIYDHLGGGFCRYATDQKWMVPHFEKMLYDNAQLLTLYSQALTLGPDALFEGAVMDTVDWLTREMRDPEGGFYAAMDADSEGVEGKFYTWRREHVKQALSEDEYLLIETLYGLDKPANFGSSWTLHRYDSWRSVVERLSLEQQDALSLLTSARKKLMTLRDQRPRPDTDKKILTAWNGLLIRGLADASAQFDQPAWGQLAQETADFLRTSCWQDKQLFASYQQGEAKHAGYLDDYANLLHGLLGLLSHTWRDEDSGFAKELADALLERFQDEENGGFFFTSHAQEALIYRPKPTMDDALPPGNGIAAQALLRLGHLTGEVKYIEAATRTLAWARPVMEKVPAAHCSLLHALEELHFPPQLVLLRGPIEVMDQWRKELAQGYTPWRTIYAIPYEGVQILPAYLPKLVSHEAQSQVTAYVCSGTECSLPLNDLAALKALLE